MNQYGGLWSSEERMKTKLEKQPSNHHRIIVKNQLRLNAAIVDTHHCACVLTGAKQCYFTTGKSLLFVLFIFVCSIMHVISK